MEFFDKLGDKIATKSKVVAEKAKDVTEVMGLKSKISSQEDIIRRNYIEIGKLFYETFGENPEEPFAQYCVDIKAAKNEIEDLEQKIKNIKEL